MKYRYMLALTVFISSSIVSAACLSQGEITKRISNMRDSEKTMVNALKDRAYKLEEHIVRLTNRKVINDLDKLSEVYALANLVDVLHMSSSICKRVMISL